MFEELVGLIDKIKDDSIGEWIVDKENDGISRCIAKIYVRSLSYLSKIFFNSSINVSTSLNSR